MATKVLRHEKSFPVVAGATILAGQLCGLNSSGQAVLADADAATPIEAAGFAVTDIASGATGALARFGVLEDASWAWTPPGKVYLSGTAGGYTETKVSTAGNIVQAVGRSQSATKLIVDINWAPAVLQAAGNSTLAVY